MIKRTIALVGFTFAATIACAQQDPMEFIRKAYPLCYQLYGDESSERHKACLEVSARNIRSPLDRDGLIAAVEKLIAEYAWERVRAEHAEAEKARAAEAKAKADAAGAKADAEKAKAKAKAAARIQQERNRELAEKPVGLIVERWWLGGFGTVFLANVTIQNNSEKRLVDFRVRCETFGNSGTGLSTLSGVLYEALAPGQRRSFELNLGMVHPQSVRARCRVD